MSPEPAVVDNAVPCPVVITDSSAGVDNDVVIYTQIPPAAELKTTFGYIDKDVAVSGLA